GPRRRVRPHPRRLEPLGDRPPARPRGGRGVPRGGALAREDAQADAPPGPGAAPPSRPLAPAAHRHGHGSRRSTGRSASRTSGSSIVDGTVTSCPSAMPRITPRRILPERVFGSAGTTVISLRAATG